MINVCSYDKPGRPMPCRNTPPLCSESDKTYFTIGCSLKSKDSTIFKLCSQSSPGPSVIRSARRVVDLSGLRASHTLSCQLNTDVSDMISSDVSERV